MSHVDDLLEELEAVVNEILVREGEDESDHLLDLMNFGNIAMSGLLTCAQLGLLKEDQVVRARTISEMYAENSEFYGKER